MAGSDADMQRSLGRIEGTQSQILSELRRLGENFSEHKNEDQKNFSSVRAMVYEHRNEVKAILDTQSAEREAHLDAQDVKLSGLKTDSDKAKGAGYVIIGIMGALATFVGTAVIAAFTGWVHLH